jgi:uncharacterized protein YjdB
VFGGTAVISYSVPNSCGTAVATTIATINPAPNPGSITGTASVCGSATIAMSNAVSGGTWSSSNAGVATISGSGVVTPVAVGTTTISYTMTNGCGTAVATKITTVTSIPSAGTITGTALVCTGYTTTLSNAVTGGTWTSSVPARATVTSTGVVNALTTGTTIISYQVNTGCGLATATRVVTVNAAANAGTILGTTSIAVGSIATMSNAVSGGTWSSSNTAIITIGTLANITGVSPGTGTISYTVVNSCSSTSATKIVTVVPIPYAPLISTIAGTGVQGYSGDGGPATSGQLRYPQQIVADTAGNVYIADLDAHVIRKRSTSGIITTIAGTGTAGYNGDGIAATAARLRYPMGVALDSANNLYIGDAGNNRVRKITPGGIITTIAGTGVGGFTGDGVATAVGLNFPSYLAFDNLGNLLVSDKSNGRVRMISTSGMITTVAGNGGSSGNGFSGGGGPATAASIGGPGGVWKDNTGDIYIGNTTNILKVNPSGIITSIAGINDDLEFYGDGMPATATGVYYPVGVWGDSAHNIYFAHSFRGRVRKYNAASGLISTVAGGGSGGDGVPATASGLSEPTGVYVSPAGNLYIAERFGYRVRLVGNTNTITGVTVLCGGSSATLGLGFPPSGGSWSSSNTAVATIGSASGVWSGVAAGTATISYVYPGGAATTIVTVNVSTAAGTITGPGGGCAGNTITLSNAISGGTWSSGATGIATVNSSGIVTCVATGTATISYAVTNGCGTARATKIVSVNPAINAGTIIGTASICVAGTATLSDGVSGGIWSSSAAGIATVNSSGVVTGMAAGTATISYTVTTACGSAAATKIVTVNAAPNAGSITGTASVCVSGTTSLSNAISGGTWS